MSSRLDLHAALKTIPGVAEVYFQPPESVKLKFPCIVYHMNYIQSDKADDLKYLLRKQYVVTVIDKNPDSPIVQELLQFMYCSFDRGYTADNLNHFVFTLYY